MISTHIQYTTYYFWLKACNNAGCSDYSNYESATPYAPPVVIPITPSAPNTHIIDQNNIRVYWSGASGATRYELYQGTSSNTSYMHRIYNNSSTSYIVSDLDAGKKYYFRVKSCNNSRCSGYSNSSYAITDPAIPSPPSRITQGTRNNQVYIYIIADGANYYRLESRRYDQRYDESAWVEYKGTSYGFYLNYDTGWAYYYRARACLNSSESSCSDYYSPNDKFYH